MRLLYDLRGATPETADQAGGIARYIVEHVRALAERAEVERLFGLIAADGAFPPGLRELGRRLELVSPDEIEALVGANGPLVHHIGSPFDLMLRRSELAPPALARPGVRRVVTLYDTIPAVSELPAGWDRLWRLRGDVVRSAERVLCISEFSARDGIEHLGLDEWSVRVIGAGVPRLEVGEEAGRPPALPGLESRFLLYTGGTDDPRKNLHRLIQAYASLDERLRAEHQLVIASKASEVTRAALEATAESAQVADRVLLPGFVPDPTLASLFTHAACVVYPSLYEGFGLPILEAMSFGTPVVASRTTACGETLDHPLAGFDPTDVGEMAAVIERVLRDEGLREELVAFGRERLELHTWDLVADRTVAAYRELAGPRDRLASQSLR